jgi:hypothetical protein
MASNTNLMSVGTFDSDQEAEKVLRAEARKFKYIAVKMWRRYLASYKPKEYVRTRKSQKSIQIRSKLIRLPNNELGMEITWENDLAWHDSVVPKSSKKGHSIVLISEGWHSVKLEKILKGAVYRFTYYEGWGYLDKVIREYDKVRDKRIGFELENFVSKKK